MFTVVETKFGKNGVGVHLHGVFRDQVDADTCRDEIVRRHVDRGAIVKSLSGTWMKMLYAGEYVSYLRVTETEGLIASIDHPSLTLAREEVVNGL